MIYAITENSKYINVYWIASDNIYDISMWKVGHTKTHFKRTLIKCNILSLKDNISNLLKVY